MTATPISQTVRYINPGVTKIVYAPTVVDISAPTRAEIDAGTDLSREVAELTGWQVNSNQVPTPDLASTFTSNTPGRTTAEDSSLTFYADKTGDDVRALLPRGTDGFIIIMDGGDVPASPMDVYPIRVASNGKMRSVGEEAARIQVQCSITSEPAEDVAVPAAV